MKFADLKDKSKNELEKLLAELREQLRQKRSQAMAGELKAVREIRSLRRSIARILTRLKAQ